MNPKQRNILNKPLHMQFSKRNVWDGGFIKRNTKSKLPPKWITYERRRIFRKLPPKIIYKIRRRVLLKDTWPSEDKTSNHRARSYISQANKLRWGNSDWKKEVIPLCFIIEKEEYQRMRRFGMKGFIQRNDNIGVRIIIMCS